MKFSADVLEKIIRKVVKEEVKKVLPALMAEAFSERYLRQVVSEVARAAGPAQPRPVAKASQKRPTNLRELMQGDEEWEEEVPKALDNDHKGIYHQNPLVRGKGGGQQTSEARQRALAMVYDGDPSEVLQDPRLVNEQTIQRVAQGDPTMAAMFEGTRPAVPENTGRLGETQQQFGEEGVPLDFMEKLGVNFNKVQQNVTGHVPPAARESVDEAYLKQLEIRRAMLDRPAN